MICKNGFDFAHHGVRVICGENAAEKKQAAVSDPDRIRDAAQRRGYRFPEFLIYLFLKSLVAAGHRNQHARRMRYPDSCSFASIRG